MTLLLALLLLWTPGWAPREGGELIGKRAPEWKGLRWLQGGPLDLARLRGQVVLVRFWTDGCPYCKGSAPALRGFHDRHRAAGLVVVGIHHPKAPESKQEDVVRKAIRELGLTFPVATDVDWTTVRAYGVETVFKSWTSVSFLVDRCGLIRFVHDGGTMRDDGDDAPAYRALAATLDRVLREKPACR